LWVHNRTRAESAAGNTIHMVVGSKLWREIVKHMGRIPAPGQKNDRPARTAPIEDFQPNILINAYKSRDVR